MPSECDGGGITVVPLVSVVAVTRNHPCSLAAALDSVRGQSFTDLEIVVVSHREAPDMRVASRQATFMHRGRFYVMDCGDVLDAKLLGANQALGEWVTFLHDNDCWLSGRLAFQMELASLNDADIISINDDRSILIKKAAFLNLFKAFNKTISLASHA